MIFAIMQKNIKIGCVKFWENIAKTEKSLMEFI